MARLAIWEPAASPRCRLSVDCAVARGVSRGCAARHRQECLWHIGHALWRSALLFGGATVARHRENIQLLLFTSFRADDPPPRMPLRNPHLQRRVGHVRVDLRRGDAAVAEEALDVADVDAFLQEVGGY